AVAPARIAEDGAATSDVGVPHGLAALVESYEELIRGTGAEFVRWGACHHETIGAPVGAVVVVRVDINEAIASVRVVPTEIQEGRAAEALVESPVGPGPRGAVVRRPAQSRIAGVADEQVEDPVHTEHAAGLAPVLAVAACLGGRCGEIHASEVGWRPGDL